MGIHNGQAVGGLPDFAIPAEVGQGTPSYGGLFVATFTAETLITGPNNVAVGLLDITFGGQNGHPQSDNNHRFVTSKGPEEWGSLTTLRAFTFLVDAARRDATVKVRIQLAGGTTFGFQNWLLKVERYPYQDVNV